VTQNNPQNAGRETDVLFAQPGAPEAAGTVTVAAGLPGKLKPYQLPAGSTIRDVLLKAELNPEGQEVRVDGETVTNLDTPLRADQTIMLFRPVRGNVDDTVTVAAGLPGKLKPYQLPAGSTIRDALLKAELNPEGQEVRVDGETVTNLDTPLRADQTIMLFRPVRGN